MTRYRFFVNLTLDTADAEFRRFIRPTGYLLAPNNATRTTRRLAHELGRRLDLLADNGNFALIGQVAKRWDDATAPLVKAAGELEEQQHRSITRPRELPPLLHQQLRAAAAGAAAAIEDLPPADAVRLPRQMELQPTHLIGAEDPTMALWLKLSLEPAYTGVSRRSLVARNRAVARRAVAELGRVERWLRSAYYPVASALTYDSAFDAGRIFGAAGIDRVAIGFGAFMADQNYSDAIAIDGKLTRLPSRLPCRYVRTALVAEGFLAGYRSERNRFPLGLHCLGLGAPIMMAVVAAAAKRVGVVSYDATSPIQDAAGGVLYVSRPAYLKIKARNVAWRMANEPAHRWTCPCPFCRQFMRRFPPRYRLGPRWLATARPTEVKVNDLRPGGALFDAYPMLSEPAGADLKPLRRAVNRTRMGHNHWVVQRLVRRLDAAAQRSSLVPLVRALTEEYARESESPAHVEAVRLGLRIALGEFGGG
jgi:hypothetical protein